MCTTLYNPIEVNLSLYNSHFSLVPFLHFLASSSSSSIPSPRSTMFYYARSENHYEEPHFLQACFLCRKPLGQNRDIFMYRLGQFRSLNPPLSSLSPHPRCWFLFILQLSMEIFHFYTEFPCGVLCSGP